MIYILILPLWTDSPSRFTVVWHVSSSTIFLYFYMEGISSYVCFRKFRQVYFFFFPTFFLFFFFLFVWRQTKYVLEFTLWIGRECQTEKKLWINRERRRRCHQRERDEKKKWIKKKKQGEEKKEMGDEWLQWLEAKQVCVVGGRRGRGGPRGSLPRPTWPLPPTWVGGPSHPGFPSCFPASAHVTPGPTSPLLPAAAPGSARLKIELGLSSSKKKST